MQVFAIFARADNSIVRQIGQDFLQQRNASGDLCAAHVAFSLNVLNQGVEDVAVLDFNPVAVVHAKAWGSAFTRHSPHAGISGRLCLSASYASAWLSPEMRRGGPLLQGRPR